MNLSDYLIIPDTEPARSFVKIHRNEMIILKGMMEKNDVYHIQDGFLQYTGNPHFSSSNNETERREINDLLKEKKTLYLLVKDTISDEIVKTYKMYLENQQIMNIKEL